MLRSRDLELARAPAVCVVACFIQADSDTISATSPSRFLLFLMSKFVTTGVSGSWFEEFPATVSCVADLRGIRRLLFL